MARWLLVADADPMARATLSAGLLGSGLAEQGDGCATGRDLVKRFTELIVAGEEVVGVVLDTQLQGGGGRSVAIALRAIERGFDVSPAALLFHASVALDPSLEQLLGYLTRAGYKARPEEVGPGAIPEVVKGLQEVLGA